MTQHARGTVKSALPHFSSKTETQLTDQVHLGSRTGLSPQRTLPLKYTCFSGSGRLKPTALSGSHGSTHRHPTLERGRLTSSTTVTISTYPTSTPTVSPEQPREIFSFFRGTVFFTPHPRHEEKTADSGAVAADAVQRCAAHTAGGVGAPTPPLPQFGVEWGGWNPPKYPRLGYGVQPQGWSA